MKLLNVFFRSRARKKMRKRGQSEVRKAKIRRRQKPAPTDFPPIPLPDLIADGLAVWERNLDFIREPRFLAAYAKGANSGHRFGSFSPDGKLQIEWRAHVCCWAASHAKLLPGDFVECGVNTGVLSLTVCDYIDFNSTGKAFWLFDTFAGIPESQMSAAEAQNRRAENEALYVDCWDLARQNFAPYPNARLIRGMVPETLSSQSIDRVCYLSIDMNIAVPERAAIEYFWPKLVSAGVVVLDDYGFRNHREQKETMDDFAAGVGVPILTLPTGQGLMIKP